MPGPPHAPCLSRFIIRAALVQQGDTLICFPHWGPWHGPRRSASLDARPNRRSSCPSCCCSRRITLSMVNMAKVMYTGVSQIRSMWETRITKQKVRQQREQERKAKSAIERLRAEWHTHVDVAAVKEKVTRDESRVALRVEGEDWRALPQALQDMVDLNELRVLNSRLHVLPRFVANFKRLQTLDLSKNCLQELPKEIGLLTGLQQLLLSYNQLRRVPGELGDCESLQRLDLSSNNSLHELPYQLSSLKKLVLLDLSVNKFSSVPIAVLRMSGLQWLDMSKNQLHELPQDIDRLERVETMLLHHNSIRYLPLALGDMGELRTLVVSADHLVQVPTLLYKLPHLKILDMRENRLQEMSTAERTSPPPPNRRLQAVDAEQEDMGKEFMTSYFQDLQKRDTGPEYTTVVSLSLQLG
ncbi:leucine-rich repeat-containing protein 2-like [Lampetra planeri]